MLAYLLMVYIYFSLQSTWHSWQMYKVEGEDTLPSYHICKNYKK